MSVTTAATFRDPSLEEAYREQGFVVTPFLDDDEVALVREGYRALVPPGDHGLTIDYMRPDRSAMYAIADLLAPVWARHFPAVFADHRPVFTTFVTKHPGPASDMFLHEDRTFVDERHFRAGTLWVPLVDVGPGHDNGGLEVIPTSHLLTDAWSGTATPELFRPYEAYLRERLEPIAVPAGHALYYDTRTLHASPANRSASPREAVVCAVAPRQADLIHVVATSRRHRRVHRVDESFFLEVHPHAVDDGVGARYSLIDEFDDDTRLGPAELVARLGPARKPGSGPEARPEPPRGIRVADRRLPLLAADLPFSAAELGGAPVATASSVRVDGADGTIGVRPVGAPVAGDPAWIETLRPIVDGAAAASVIAVEAGSRALVHLDGGTTAPPTGVGPAGTTAWMIDVIDVAPAAATVEVGGQAMPIDEGLRLEVDSGVGPLLLSNRGPGLLAVLVSQVAPAAPVASSTASARAGFGARARRLAHRLRTSLAS